MVNKQSLLTDEWMRPHWTSISRFLPEPHLPLNTGLLSLPKGFPSSAACLLLEQILHFQPAALVYLTDVGRVGGGTSVSMGGLSGAFQALRKHRNCWRLCAASASSLSPVGWRKWAGCDVQLRDEKNKCGIPHSFCGI